MLGKSEISYFKGTYLFSEEKQCFFSNVKIVLYLVEVSSNKYKSEFYYFDEYEIYLEEHQKEFYDGDEIEVKKMAIESFNASAEIFMGFPIFYSNVLSRRVRGSK